MAFRKLITAILPLTSAFEDEEFLQYVILEPVEMLHTDGFLSFSNKQLKLDTEEEVEDVAQQIEQFRPLNVLELKGNTLGVKAGERLALALEGHPELKRCLWSDLFTGRLKDQIPPILKSLGSSMIRSGCCLTEIDLSDNAFGPIGADGIAELLVSPACYSLETLKLNNNGLGAGGVKIAECLIDCFNNARRDGHEFKLKRFVAGRNRLEDPGARALSEAFSLIGSLEEIRIPQNGIRAAGIKYLANAFSENPNLRIIDINDNTCTVTGAKSMGKAIKNLAKLEEIDLGDCLCRNDGSYSLLNAISAQDRSKLRIVNLSGNEIQHDVIAMIIQRFCEQDLEHVKVSLEANRAGSNFETLEGLASSNKNINLGEWEDDEGSFDEEEEEDFEEDYADNESMEEAAGDAESIAKKEFDEYYDDVISFLDQQLKLDSASDAEKVAQVIEKAQEMRTLELKGNTLGVEAGDRLEKALKLHPELENCLWSDLFTGRLKTEIPQILIALSNGLIQANCRLVELDLSDNAFGPIGAAGLEILLSSSVVQSLQTLKLNNNGLGSGGKTIAQWLLDAYRHGGKKLQLKTFIAGRNRLENPGAIAFAKLFEEMKSLERLELPQNGINKEGIEALAAALGHNFNLKYLNLSDNTATEIGAVAIAKILPKLQRLEHLDLGDLLCRSHGCHEIIDALSPSKHKALRSVNLGGSEIGHATTSSLINKWAKFSRAASNPLLKLHGNNLGDLFDQMRALIDELNSNADLGLSEDDCGSLSGDEEERLSDMEGEEEEDGAEEYYDEEEDEEENEEVEQDSAKKNLQTANHINELFKQHNDDVAQTTLKMILELSDIVKEAAPEIFASAVERADKAIQNLEQLSTGTHPLSTIFVNNLIAQLKIGVKPETKLNVKSDRNTIVAIFQKLLERGRLQKDKQLVQFFLR